MVAVVPSMSEKDIDEEIMLSAIDLCTEVKPMDPRRVKECNSKVSNDKYIPLSQLAHGRHPGLLLRISSQRVAILLLLRGANMKARTTITTITTITAIPIIAAAFATMTLRRVINTLMKTYVFMICTRLVSIRARLVQSLRRVHRLVE